MWSVMNNKNRFLPEDFKKGWMLYISAILTWSFVSYLSLVSLPLGTELAVRGTAFVAFIVLFIGNLSYFVQDNSQIKIIISISAQILIVWLLIYFDRYDISPILFVLIATQLANNFTKKQAILIWLLMNIGYFFLITTSNERGLHSLFLFGLLEIFAYSAMDIMINAQKDRQKLAEINQELLATRFMLKESTQRKERLRISRDLHDVIGHQLTALALNLEVSSHKVPDEFKSMLQQNLQQAKTLLSDVREVVKEMRTQEQFDLVATIQNLVEQLPNCQLSVQNIVAINSLSLKQQLVFCLQEGISNALRHGKANKLILTFKQLDSKIEISLKDNGQGKAAIAFGNGLKGMQERLADFKGEVALFTTKDGCELNILVEDCYD